MLGGSRLYEPLATRSTLQGRGDRGGDLLVSVLLPAAVLAAARDDDPRVLRDRIGDVDPIETKEPKAEADARALRHATFIIQLHRSGDPDQLATAYEFVFKDFSAKQVGAIADQIQMKPDDKKRFVDAFAADAYTDALRALDASGQELQLQIQPIAQRDAKLMWPSWRRGRTKKASDTSI
eukprot:scaffold88155_cov56-Phaeocystis_antarctica.AAC.2